MRLRPRSLWLRRSLCSLVLCLLLSPLGVLRAQMGADEYAAYQRGVTDSVPADRARDFEAYLQQYPNSTVKVEVLEVILFAYSQMGDLNKQQDAANRLLAIDPANLRALTVSVYVLRVQADATADPVQKQELYARIEAQAGMALLAARPARLSQQEFDELRALVVPAMYSAAGTAALNRKDSAAAVDAFRRELMASKSAGTEVAAQALNDTFLLAQAYYGLPAPDFLNCAYFAARASTLAAEPYKTLFQPLATYCYRKYHGTSDGYDQLAATARDALFPPPTLAVNAAKQPAEIAAEVVRTTPNLATLALSDKEFVLQYGRAPDATAVWNSIRGVRMHLDEALVIESNTRELKLAVAADAREAHRADFTVRFDGKVQDGFVAGLSRPPDAIPAVGALVAVWGTASSFTREPMLVLGKGSIGAASAYTELAPPASAVAAAALPEVPAAAPARASAPGRGVKVVDTGGVTLPAASIPHNYALVFATNTYAHWPKLDNPVPDADALSSTLKSLFGFQVEELRNPSAREIVAKLTEYLHRDFQPQDQLLIFFSGHGYFDTSLGQGYIIPADALKPADDFGNMHMIGHDLILRYVNRIPATHVVLMMDACFSGTLDRKVADGAMRGDTSPDVYAHVTLPELMQRKQDKRTRRYFTSGGADFVPDGEPGHHSPFLAALLVALNEGADRKGYVTLNDLQEGLETVKPEPRWGDIQNDNDAGADFILVTTTAARLLTGN